MTARETVAGSRSAGYRSIGLRWLVPLCALLLLLAPLGCGLIWVDLGGDWVEWSTRDVSFDRLWQEAKMALWNDPAAFKIDAEDREAGTIMTYWRFFPYQFAFDTWRERENMRHPYRLRAHIEIAPRSEGGYEVSVRVERERNTDEVDPSNETRAIWSRQPDDRRKAEQLLFRIRNSIELYLSDPTSSRSGRSRSGNSR